MIVLFCFSVIGTVLAEDTEVVAGTVKLSNPLGDTVDIRIILQNILNIAFGFLGAVALLIFVYGGFLWLTSAGNQDKVGKGNKTMFFAVIGLFLIFGSYGIMNLVLNTVGAKEGKDLTGLNISGYEGNSQEDMTKADDGCYCQKLEEIKDGNPVYIEGNKEKVLGLDEGGCTGVGAGYNSNLKVGKCEWKTFQSK